MSQPRPTNRSTVRLPPVRTESRDSQVSIGPSSPTVGYYLMSPEQGGHTSRPYFTLQPAGFARFSEFLTRDIVVLVSEATANTAGGRCTDAPHVGFVVDVTVENSITAPPGVRVEHDPYQGPMGLSTLWIDPRFGELTARVWSLLRGEALKALGNGVIPQQAEAAIRHLLRRDIWTPTSAACASSSGASAAGLTPTSAQGTSA